MQRAVAIVRRVWPESARFTGVLLEVDPEVAALYRRPGQYIVAHGPKEPIFLGLCSSPGEVAALELLLGPAAMSALEPAEGARWNIDAPTGPGFPVEPASGRDVVLLGVGSGVGPLRAVVESLRKHRSWYRRIMYYAGARQDDHHVYLGSESSWRADGIEIHRTSSRPFVQDVLRTQVTVLDTAEAYVCGHREMVAETHQVLTKLGVSAEHIHQNF